MSILHRGLCTSAVLAVFALVVPFTAAAANHAKVGTAGPDRTTVVGNEARLGEPLTGANGNATERWRIVKAPRGKAARLIHPHAAMPVFVARRNGTYVLRETVKRGRSTSRDEVTVFVRPNDPPIGVPLETLSDSPDGAIRIDGKPVPDTRDRNGIFVAVLERKTREVVRYGTAPRHKDGLRKLIDIENEQPRTDGYLMIVSAPHGVFPNDVDLLQDLTKKLGLPEFTVSQRDRLKREDPFSIIGIPGGATGSAWMNIGRTERAGEPRGDIRGLLQVSTATGASGWYDFVSPDEVTFDTQASGAGAGRNTIQFDHNYYTATLPAGDRDGFQLLAIDSDTLKVIVNSAIPTNGSGDVSAFQNALAVRIEDAARSGTASGGSPPIVILQSIGRPRGQFPGWENAAQWIQKLGGNRYVFDSLWGSGPPPPLEGPPPQGVPIRRSYALVGSLDSPLASVEASSSAGDASLVGALARGHDFSYVPTVAGPPGGMNPQLIEMAYEAPTPFPAFDTPGLKSAETYIGKHIHLCAEHENRPCPVRPLYYRDRRDQLVAAQSDLRRPALDYPGDGFGFTRPEYDRVRTQLETELAAVIRVREYFEALQKPFDKAGQAGRINLKKIGDEMYEAVGPPPLDNTTSRGLEYGSKFAALLGALPPPFGNVGKAISSSLALAAFATRDDGSPLLGIEVKIKAEKLAEQFQERMFDASRSMTGLANLFVSDYGKLMKLDSRLGSASWELSPGDESLDKMSLAARQQYAQTLLPVAYPWLLRGTPHVGNANGLSCGALGAGNQAHPWASQPGTAQTRAIVGWTPQGVAITASIFFSLRGPNGGWRPDISLAAKLAVSNRLFDPVNPHTGALGMDKLETFSTRVFGEMFQANDTARRCDLPTNLTPARDG